MAKRQGLGRGLNALIEEPSLGSGNSAAIQNTSSFPSTSSEKLTQPAVNFPEGITQEEDGSLSLEVER